MFGVGGRCDRCGVAARGLCGSCRAGLAAPEPPDLTPEIDRVVAVFSYDGVGADLLRALKFGNRRTSIDGLVRAAVPALAGCVDGVIAVPPDRTRRRRRGYDLPELLARRLGGLLDVTTHRSLVRCDSGTQRDRSRRERASSVVFEASGRVDGRMLLVDDVVTTGATGLACARALRDAGAHTLTLFALAVTPPTRRDHSDAPHSRAPLNN